MYRTESNRACNDLNCWLQIRAWLMSEQTKVDFTLKVPPGHLPDPITKRQRKTGNINRKCQNTQIKIRDCGAWYLLSITLNFRRECIQFDRLWIVNIHQRCYLKLFTGIKFKIGKENIFFITDMTFMR